jgi:hypothetical protein
VYERVFEQEAAAGNEEFKLSEAAAAALAILLSELGGPDNIHATLAELVHWIPLCSLASPVFCYEILWNAKLCQISAGPTHFMNFEHQLAVLDRMKLKEVERTGIYNYCSRKFMLSRPRPLGLSARGVLVLGPDDRGSRTKQEGMSSGMPLKDN